jgi:signal transduction histidine kinase
VSNHQLNADSPSPRLTADDRRARIRKGRHDLHLAGPPTHVPRDATSAQDRQDAACASAVADDRERMAGDLYDSVIHRLFAAGLQLQATCQMVEVAEQVRIEATIDLLDASITELRNAIFSLRRPGPLTQSRPARRAM